jgi:hypothetical protein
MREAEACPAMR